MRILKFYGVSDDLFEIEGTPGRGKSEEPDEREPGTVEIKDSKGSGLRVYCQYAVTGNGCWMVGIAPMDEDVPIPDWSMKFTLGGRGYSAMLTLEAPDDAVVSNVEDE